MSIAQTEPLARFIEEHPLKIELLDGTHVRFRDAICAARSALWHHAPVFDESSRRTYSLADCLKMTAESDRTTRRYA